MQEAALKGQLKVLQYLNTHAPELSCTTKAMNDAAAGGFLDIVNIYTKIETKAAPLERWIELQLRAI